MSHLSASTTDPQSIDLKDPRLAAFLAWLVPGLGHFYQGRRAKGALFAVCILGTFFYGLFLGEGRVVYASFAPEHRRLPYVCQVATGLPALPALVQWSRVRNNEPPLWGGFMAPPKIGRHGEIDELNDLHKRLNRYFELGTVYTMIAGLLNVLAIYDALAGPAYSATDDNDEEANNQRGPPDESGAAEPAEQPSAGA